jgi:hypothetical protein
VRRLWVAFLVLAVLVEGRTGAAAPPAVRKAAPAFTLTDVDGKKRTLAEFRGRPVALFFFCGCHWCADVGREWAEIQRGGLLSAAEDAKPAAAPITVIVYSGLNGDAARNLAAHCGLDRKQTVLLPDLKEQVSKKLYDAEPCPRVFVVDPRGVLRYTNNGKDDAPRLAPALVIASKTLEAIQAGE